MKNNLPFVREISPLLSHIFLPLASSIWSSPLSEILVALPESISSPCLKRISLPRTRELVL